MIRPSRHDFNIDRSSCHGQLGQRSNLPSSAGPRFELIEVVAHVVLALVFVVGCIWFYETFLAAIPAISRVVSGGK